MDGGIEAILGELIEMMQATAPTLWAIAQRQVLVNTVGNAVWGGLFLLAAIVLGLIARHCARLWDEDPRRHSTPDGDWTSNNTAWLAGFLAVAAAVASFILLSRLIAYVANPDYYAIKVLLELVR